jgi:hypothetical protein
MSWAATEFESLDLGDPRRKRRAISLIDDFSAKPTASIPQACGDWSDTQAAYRFFSNEKVDWTAILASHIKSSVARMARHDVVLCIQDTTELDFNGQKATGLGPLSYERQRGMYVHPTYAVSTSREPLGVLDAWMWAREFKNEDGKRPGMKESLRWIEGYERLAELALELPTTRLMYLADREADFMELMVRARDLGIPVDWLIRSKNNRTLPDGDKLWSSVTKDEPLGEIRFTLPKGREYSAREVVQAVWAKRVELPDGKKGVVQASCIVAREINPPAGEKPVEWRLLSNLFVETLEQAVQMIDWYRARWEIEMLFHVFKNGCKIEAMQLEHIDRIERALVLYLIVAWRIARLMRLGRTCPDMDAQLIFDRDEWQAAYILNKQKLPVTAPTLNEVVRLVARLGGFLARKGDGEPGVKTIWLGMQRVIDFAAGVRYSRENQESATCV